jgi:hypothetical protein
MEYGKYIHSLLLGMVHRGDGYHNGFYVYDIDHMHGLVEVEVFWLHQAREMWMDYRHLASRSRYDCRACREWILGMTHGGCQEVVCLQRWVLSTADVAGVTMDPCCVSRCRAP